MASWKGHTEIVEKLMARPTGVNQAETNEYGYMLIWASQEGHTEIVEKLMARPDIDVNKVATGNGFTALIVASREGHTEIEKLMARPDRRQRNQRWVHGPHWGELEGPHRDRREADDPPRHRRQQGTDDDGRTALIVAGEATPRSSRS